MKDHRVRETLTIGFVFFIFLVLGTPVWCQSAPTATTGAASAVGSVVATLNGTVNANGENTTVTFEYGLDIGYGGTVTADQSPVSGSTNTAVSAVIGELSANTTYHFRVVAVNASGTTYGGDMTFETLPHAPLVETNAASGIGADSATLNGTVNPNGASTAVTFEYGTDTGYGTTVPADQSPVNGVSAVPVSRAISGLANNTTYHYRVAATNAGGTTYGGDMTFTIGTVGTAPTATTGAATGIGSSGATLNGTVNAENSATVVTFEYGLDTNYGSTIVAGQSPVSGSTNTAVSGTVSELLPNTTYHYRVVGQNANGTTNGADMSFTTLPLAPSASTGAASPVGTTTATLRGTVNANNASTTVTFQYGTTTGYGSTVTASQSPVTGSTATAVSRGITGLTNGVTYHYRVVAVNAGGTTYGADMTFTTGAVAPAATTSAATAVGTTTATLNGTVNANGFSTAVVFEYGTTTSYDRTVAADPAAVTGSTNTPVNASLINLTPGTTYHYRVAAANAGGITYGADMTLTTLAPPSVTTGAATSVSISGATLNGTVNANGSSSTVTFEYGLTTAYGTTVTADQSPVTGSSGTAVSKAITGLANNTIYHYRAVGQNANGTTYGADMTFTTTIGAPTVTTDAATSVLFDGATLNGTVDANNSSTTVTFEYGMTAAYGTTVTADQSPVTGVNVPVSAGITGLANNTTYHYRVVGQNASGTTNGADMTFTTSSAPSATTNAATAVGGTFATLNGTVNGNSLNTTITFQYGLTAAYGTTVSANPNFVSDSIDTPVSTTITGLANNTTYHYRVVGQNASGTTNGADMTFTTTASPTAVTNAASAVGATSATVNGTVNANNASTTVTFDYGTDTNYGRLAVADQSPVSGSNNTAVSNALSLLIPNTTYHYRVVAQNVNDTVYGGDMTFTTASAPPTVTTGPASGVGAASATLNGTVNANNSNTTVTFQYGTTIGYGNTATADQSPVSGTNNTAVSATLAGLLPNTTYHFRAVGQNGAGTANGADMTFTTGIAAPTATTSAPSGIGTTGATLNGTVNANGTSTTVIFQYGTTISYDREAAANPGTVTGSAATAVSANLAGLLANLTTYHYRVVAQNAAGTTYGADMAFTTGAPPPAVTTNPASGIGATGATLNGTVNANNNSTTVTFQYGTTTGYGNTITADQSPVSGSNNTAVSATLAGLLPNTTYHFRAVGQNGVGTTNGSDRTFTTAAIAPTVATGAASAVGATGATLNGIVNANNNSTTVTFQYGTTTGYGNTVTADQSPVSGSNNTAVSATLAGLLPNTTYHFRVVGQNVAGITYGADRTFATGLAPPTVSGSGAAEIGPNWATLNALVNANNSSTAVMFEYGLDTHYGNTVAADQSPITGNTDLTVSKTVTHLGPDTTYHFRVVAQNAAGTTYGPDVAFSTTETTPVPTLSEVGLLSLAIALGTAGVLLLRRRGIELRRPSV